MGREWAEDDACSWAWHPICLMLQPGYVFFEVVRDGTYRQVHTASAASEVAEASVGASPFGVGEGGLDVFGAIIQQDLPDVAVKFFSDLRLEEVPFFFAFHLAVVFEVFAVAFLAERACGALVGAVVFLCV